MENEYRIYIVDGTTSVEEDFTTDDIVDNAIDIIKAETLPKMLEQLIDGLNDGTLSDNHWYFLYDENEMTLLSNIPNGFVEIEVPTEEPNEHTERLRKEARDFDYGMGEKHDNY